MPVFMTEINLRDISIAMSLNSCRR